MRRLIDIFLTHEQNRLVLWTPVFLGIGIALYFALPAEPSRLIIVVPVITGLTLGLLYRYAPKTFGTQLILCAMFLVSAGMSITIIRTHALNTPMLARKMWKKSVEGIVEDVTYLKFSEQKKGKLARVVLRLTQQEIPLNLYKVRLRLREDPSHPLRVGQHIRVKANFTPLPPPTWPLGYDFRRRLYFEGIGATGFCLERPLIIQDVPQERTSLWVAHTRSYLTNSLTTHLKPPLGSVAAALLTGHTESLPASVRSDFAASGMAHLLAISGLHMSIVAGLIFFLIQSVLTLWTRVTLFYPLHKIAAAATMIGTFLYLQLSGCHIPATRAFLMTCLAMFAIMLDRSPVSLRLVAFAATAILVYRPENLISPSFQLSFAAVTALIATFEPLSVWLHTDRLRYKAFRWLSASLLSTLVAGLATLPYTAAFFHQITLLGMMANLIAIPLTTFVIMPLGLLFICGTLVHMENLIAPVLGFSLNLLTQIAHGASQWPLASLSIPSGMFWALPVITLSGLWIFLMNSRLRLLGVLPLGIGMWALLTPHPPHILMDAEGKVMAYFDPISQTLWSTSLRRGGFAQRSWIKATGAKHHKQIPFGHNEDGWMGNTSGCFCKTAFGLSLLLAQKNHHLPFCTLANIVCSLEPLRFKCEGSNQKLRLDRFSVWRNGSIAVWLKHDHTFYVRSSRKTGGHRPWTKPSPHRYTKSVLTRY